MAVQHASLHRVYGIIVVPAEFGARFYGVKRKKRYPRKLEVVCVNENVLHEDIRRTAVVKPATYVAPRLGVHYIRLLDGRQIVLVEKGIVFVGKKATRLYAGHGLLVFLLAYKHAFIVELFVLLAVWLTHVLFILVTVQIDADIVILASSRVTANTVRHRFHGGSGIFRMSRHVLLGPLIRFI